MAEFKIVIGAKDGKSIQKEVKDQEAKSFIGMKIGDTVKGEVFGLTGYEFLITGGSDHAGFPMRKDVPGSGRKKILAISGVGLKAKRRGQRQRKTVSGSVIYDRTAQINLKVLKEGKQSLFEEPAAEAPAEGGEAPAEEKKE